MTNIMADCLTLVKYIKLVGYKILEVLQHMVG